MTGCAGRSPSASGQVASTPTAFSRPSGATASAPAVLPDTTEPPAAGGVDGHPVDDEEIARILGDLARNPLGLSRDDDFLISIAGAQEKTAFLHWGGQWLRPTGSTPTTHIFKPQIGRLSNGLDLSNSVENEYLCLTLARAFGLPTAKVDIARFGDKRVLIVERFDRLVTADRRLIPRAAGGLLPSPFCSLDCENMRARAAPASRTSSSS